MWLGVALGVVRSPQQLTLARHSVEVCGGAVARAPTHRHTLQLRADDDPRYDRVRTLSPAARHEPLRLQLDTGDVMYQKDHPQLINITLQIARFIVLACRCLFESADTTSHQELKEIFDFLDYATIASQERDPNTLYHNNIDVRIKNSQSQAPYMYGIS